MQQENRHQRIFNRRQRRAFANILFSKSSQSRRAHLHQSIQLVHRARAFKEGFEPSDVDTQTYLFIADVARQPARPPGFPTTWSGGFPADYEVDPDVVKAALPGYGLEEALLSIPSVSLTMNPSDLFGADGGIYYNSVQNWERQGSIEVLYPDGTKGLQANAGLRIHGYTSADHGFTPKHSFRVVFKSQFGPSKLKFPLFPSSPVERFDQVVLRGMSTDSWPVMDGWPSPIPGVPRWFREKSQYLREQWMKDSQLDSHIGIARYLYYNEAFGRYREQGRRWGFGRGTSRCACRPGRLHEHVS